MALLKKRKPVSKAAERPLTRSQKILPFKDRGRSMIWIRLHRFAQSLPDHELRVLLFIYLRTLGFGLQVESISREDFLEGVVRRGKRVTFAVGVNAVKLDRAIASLVQRNAIRTRQIAGLDYFYPNLDWSVSGLEELPGFPDGTFVWPID